MPPQLALFGPGCYSFQELTGSSGRARTRTGSSSMPRGFARPPSTTTRLPLPPTTFPKSFPTQYVFPVHTYAFVSLITPSSFLVVCDARVLHNRRNADRRRTSPRRDFSFAASPNWRRVPALTLLSLDPPQALNTQRMPRACCLSLLLASPATRSLPTILVLMPVLITKSTAP